MEEADQKTAGGSHIHNSDTPTSASDSDSSLPTGLAEIMDHPKIKEHVDNCQKTKKSSGRYPSGSNLGDCIWNTLPPDTKAHVSDYLEMKKEKNPGDRTPASKGKAPKYEGVSLSPYRDGVNPSKNSDKDSPEKKVEDFFYNHLMKGLYGDSYSGDDSNGDAPTGGAPSDTVKVVGHNNFYDLYKNQIGKNLISGISSYCLDTAFSSLTNTNTLHLLFDGTTEAQKENNRKKHIGGLSTATTTTGPDGSTKKSSQSAVQWQSCLRNLKNLCYGEPHSRYSQPAQQTQIKNHCANDSSVTSATTDKAQRKALAKCQYCADIGSSGITIKSECNGTAGFVKSYEDSSKRACNVVDLIENARQAIISVDAIKDRYTKLFGNEQAQMLNAGNVEFYESKGETSISNLTNVSSHEIVHESGLKGVNEQKQEEFKKCFDSTGSGRIVDAKVCEEFLRTDRGAQEGQIAEYKLRQEAMNQRYDNIKDEAQLIEVLEEEGYEKDQAADLIKKEGFANLKDKLVSRQKREADTLNESLLDRMDETTSQDDGQVTNSDVATLQKIGKELESNTKRLQQLIHFNNVVSSFLDVQDDKGNSSRNIATFNKEFENNPESLSEVDGENTQRQIQSQGLLEDARDTSDEEGPDGDNTVLTKDQINEALLNYSNKED